MGSRVFVLNKAGHDYTPAKKFGTEIIPLTTGNLSIFDIDRNAYTFIEQLLHFKFDPDQDYIALSGNLIIGFTFGLIMGKYFPKFKLLIFNAKERNYRVRIINLNAIKINDIKKEMFEV